MRASLTLLHQLLQIYDIYGNTLYLFCLELAERQLVPLHCSVALLPNMATCRAGYPCQGGAAPLPQHR